MKSDKKQLKGRQGKSTRKSLMAGINTKILFYLIFYAYFWRLYLRTIFEITLILVLPTMEFTVMQ